MPRRQQTAQLASRVPIARAEKLVIEEVGEELLVYDLTVDRAHSLSSIAARVWRACDGQRDVAGIAAHLSVDDETVTRALDGLRDCRLLDGETPAAANGMTRRDLTMRAAKVGAAVSAVPMIVSVVAPVPAAAATIEPRQCMLFTDRDCDNCTNICGCCCCGQAGGGNNQASCKLCYTTSGCGSFTGLPGGEAGNCSSKAPDEPRPTGNTCTRFSELPTDSNNPQLGPFYDCKTTGSVPPKRVYLEGTDRCCDYTFVPPLTTTTT